MQHVAIDLGKKESQICVRAPDGQILDERKIPTVSLERFLQQQPFSRVILETCSESFSVADKALDSKHEVRVVPATLVRSLGVGARGIKTDRRDAQVLSEVSCRIDLPSVHVPSHVARERRALCQMRETLIASCVSLTNCVRGWARTQLLKIPPCGTATFPRRVRENALKTHHGLANYVERLLLAIEALNEQIKLADKELEKLAEQDPICQRLMSVPGVGPVTSVRFMAALDDRSRFPSAHAVQAYLGLTPGENSSSERKQRTGITKAGPAAMRRALVQAAWNVRRFRPNDPISLWAQEIEKRRGKFIATVAVARKLAGILYAMWRDGSRYEPGHAQRKGS
ncbi:MAG: IS110 family transposase [Polyangiaceae bacterium]|nr:IS110 family transposase [Polyangiaceae bacterium]